MKIKKHILIPLMVLLLFGSMDAMAAIEQAIQVKGKVVDNIGEPVIGANVVVKGTTTGVITSIDGSFAIDAVKGSTIVVSFIGYLSQEVKVTGNFLNITLENNTELLDEVVVVGYGVQKKANLTGAIATVGAKELEDRPVTNAAAALQGKVANLNISNGDGGPGKKASFNIRGYAGLDATYSPLVIIDGVTGYFDDLNPNDIETLTVLKDAAASAIYGAQAAYGVILVTTKSGKKNEKTVINYNNNFSFNSPTVLPKTAGSLEFSRLFREADINGGGSGIIDLETMERIEKYYYDPTSIPNNVPQRDNPDRWADWGDGRSNANEDWQKAMFKNNQLNQQHNISIRGGSDKTTYVMSLGYLKDEGKLRYYDDHYQRYNALAKITTDVMKWLTVGLNVRYSHEKSVSPAYGMNPGGSVNDMIGWTQVVWPTIPVRDPNGHFSPAGRMVFIADANPQTSYTDNFWGTANVVIKPLKGWTINADFTYNKWMNKRSYSKGLIYSYSVSNEPYLEGGFGTEDTRVWQESNNDDFTSMNAYTTYEKEFKGHNFKIMAGMQSEYKKNFGLYANKMGMVLPGQPSISTSTGKIEAWDSLDHYATLGFFGRFNYDYKSRYLFEFDLRRDGSSRYAKGHQWGTFPAFSTGKIEAWDSLDHYATLGFFGRFNYDYKSRYLFEFDLRRDGSSRYAKGHQWGTFPAFSAGWNVAKEAFFEPYTSILSELRLRGSWGELGNMRGKNYQYISTVPYNATTDYIMGDKRISAFGAPNMIAYNTWEKNRTLDFGVDIAALNNRLTMSFDWYRRDIIGLITKGVTLPAVLGVNSPDTNNADIRNEGWELTLGWRDQFSLASKSFNYSVSFNLSDYQGTVLKYSNPKGLIYDYYVGKKMGTIWGYTTDHIMTDPAEAKAINDSGVQNKFGGDWVVGDIKYVNLDDDPNINDGNQTLEDHGDLSIIGNDTPRYNFGFGFNADWNGIDFSMFLQGTMKRDLWLEGPVAFGLGGGQWGSNVWKNTLDCWREDGSNPDPWLPRLYLWSTSKNLQKQTRYMDTGAYCRLKNIQLGYSLPGAIINKVGLEKVRIYFSGDNLLTFSGINENFDPEAPWGGAYPISKSISFGVNVTF